MLTLGELTGFIIEKDTIGRNNYNQIKGIRIFGKFFNGKIKNLMVDQLLFYCDLLL